MRLTLIALYLTVGALTGCSLTKIRGNDTVYQYSNGFITDRDQRTVFNYANGFITKHIPRNQSIQINNDLEITRITDQGYVYTAWT